MDPNHEAIPRLGSTELRRKNGIIPVADSNGSASNNSPHHVISSDGHGRNRDSSPSTAGGSGNRSRSHSGASTTAFLALQDDISESSEGDYVRHSRDVGKDSEAGPAIQPPSPNVPTMAPIVPSPLFQTMVAPSHLEARAGQAVPEALTRVEEVVEPSIFKSVLTITAQSQPKARPGPTIPLNTLYPAAATPAEPVRPSRDFSFRLPSDSFASDDAIDADDNYDPASSADDDDMGNSPRPYRPTRGSARIPKFKLDSSSDSDANARNDDDDDDDGEGEVEPYLSRHFSESSIKTAVPLRRGAGSVAEGMYTSFRLQRSSNAGTRTIRSRRGSLVSKASAHSKSKSQSRSISRPRASSNAAHRTSTEDVNDRDTANRASVSSPESLGKLDRMGRSRARIGGDSFRGRQVKHSHPGALEAEQHIHNMAWSKFRERVEDEIDAGNIQLASLLVLVGGEQVLNDRQRSETLLESYIGEFHGSMERLWAERALFLVYLSRLRLHTSAAMLRKEAPFRRLRDITMVI